MERRLLVFFAITFVLVTAWPLLFPPVPLPEGSPPVGAEASTAPSEAPDVQPGRASAPVLPESPETLPEAGPTEPREYDVVEASRARTIVVETDLYRLVLNNRGARVSSMTLAEYLDGEGRPYEFVGQAVAEHLDVLPLDLELGDPAQTQRAREALYSSDAPDRVSVEDGKERTVTLRWADGRGLEVEKRLTFGSGTYRIATVVSVKIRGQEVPKSILYGAGVGNEVTQSRYIGADKGLVLSRGEIEVFTAEEIDEGEGGGSRVAAAGVSSHYFAGILVPADDGVYGARFRTDRVPTEDEKRKERSVITSFLDAPASAANVTIYMGPKKLERMQALAPGLGEIIDFGWMRALAVLLRPALMKIYDVVGNFGWAIVLLTVAISVMLLPLKHYSFVSMRRMQKIAPQTKKIRDRYKKVKPTDPRYQEMNKEIMALHKEHGVNPLSGCLPMLLMLPFFFAFYSMLMGSIELRQAPFILWIRDLSVHDPFFVLPVLMGGTQMLIQRMTPQPSADPVQAKLMSFMPIMFTFFLALAPAGLVLYWFTNNLVSMGQQMVTNRFFGDKEEAAAPEAAKSGKKSKKKKTAKSAAE